MKKIILLLVLATRLMQAYSQSLTFGDRAGTIQKNIRIEYYDRNSGLYFDDNIVKANRSYSHLWSICALFQASIEMQRIGRATIKPEEVTKTLYQYLKPGTALSYQAKPVRKGMDDRFFDDNEWLAITFIEVYRSTKEKDNLQKATKLFDFILTGVDNVIGGGVYWKDSDRKTKNSCSTGPAIYTALRLYEATREEKYKQIAFSLYSWINRTLQAPSGLYYDHIKTNSNMIDKRLYSYNSGMMVQVNTLFYQLFRDTRYLKEAKRIASEMQRHFFNAHSSFQDYWFTAVSLRGFLALSEVDKDFHRLLYFKEYAKRIWDTERDNNNLLGRENEKYLIDQAAMLEINALLAQLR